MYVVSIKFSYTIPILIFKDIFYSAAQKPLEKNFKNFVDLDIFKVQEFIFHFMYSPL